MGRRNVRCAGERSAMRLMWLIDAGVVVSLVACGAGTEAPTDRSGDSPSPTPSGAYVAGWPSVEAPSPADLSPGSRATADSQGVRVLEVTDGDTLRVSVSGAPDRVRLIGINSPESDECFAAEAQAALDQLVGGRDIELVRDVSERDQFGRLLAYVFVEDLHVNEEMVRRGYALARRYPPDTARELELVEAQRAAEEEEVGMWGADGCISSRDDVSVSLYVEADAPGDDNANLNGEWLEIRNEGAEPLDLSGWMVKDESASHRYRFDPGTVVPEGETLTLYTGCGEDEPLSRYWCKSRSAAWNNAGDTAFLIDPDGRTVATHAY